MPHTQLTHQQLSEKLEHMFSETFLEVFKKAFREAIQESMPIETLEPIEHMDPLPSDPIEHMDPLPSDPIEHMDPLPSEPTPSLPPTPPPFVTKLMDQREISATLRPYVENRDAADMVASIVHQLFYVFPKDRLKN